MERIAKHLSYANVVATLALIFAMTGGAIAATGGFTSNGKLQGCIGGNGALSVVKPGKKCKKGQTAVSWSQTGPAGAKGASGTPGAPGAAGAAGSSGSAGTSAVTLWAEIDEAGNLTHASGATGISGPANNPQVTFDRDISKCAITATINEGSPGDVFAGHGDAPNEAGIATTATKAGVTVLVSC